MDKNSAQKYKTLLTKEHEEIVEMLTKIADRTGESDSFTAKVENFGDDVTEFEDEEADEAEELGNRIGIVEVLTEKLRHISSALSKIKRSAYGTCEKCQKDIEGEVLLAIPSSELCKSCKQSSMPSN